MLEQPRSPFKHITLTQELIVGGFLLLVALIGTASAYGYKEITTLSREVAMLRVGLASTTSVLGETTTSLHSAIADTTTHLQSQIGGVQEQVGAIDGTVTDLKKLSTTDQELLAKYSKVFFLSENYIPTKLAPIPPEYLYTAGSALRASAQVVPYLANLLAAARNAGVDLFVESAYRSFKTQANLKSQYTFVYGAGTANKFSADQGYSEHQLGTAVDFITTGTGGALVGFDKHPAYAWLRDNAYRYGFVLSYPPNNGYYIFEPWHWRFVGIKLATDLQARSQYFYEMNQREIDAYLASLFD